MESARRAATVRVAGGVQEEVAAEGVTQPAVGEGEVEVEVEEVLELR